MNTHPVTQPPAAPPPVRSAEQARKERERREQEALVDAESEQSFPASDPPSWTLGAH